MRRSLRIVAAVLLGLAVAVGLGAAAVRPIVRYRVEAEARARGIELSTARVGVSLGRVRLDDVEVKIEKVPALHIHADQIVVATGVLPPRVEQLEIRGGTIRVSGSVEEVERQIAAWRGSPEETATSSRVSSGPGLRVSGLEVVWDEAFGSGSAQHAWGVRYERTSDGTESIGADLVRLVRSGISVELKEPAAELERRDGQRVLHKLAAAEVAGRIDLDRRVWSALTGLAANKDAPPGQRALPSKTKTKVQVGQDPFGARVRRQLGSLATTLGSLLPADASLDLAQLTLELASKNQRLTVGPGRLKVSRAAKRIRLELTPGDANQSTPLAVRFDLPLEQGEVGIELRGGPVSLAALGIQNGAFGLVNVKSTTLTTQGRVVLSKKGDTLRFDGRTAWHRLSLHHPSLAKEPIQDLDLAWRGKGELSGDLKQLRLEEAELRIGTTRLEVSGMLEWDDHALQRGSLQGGVPLASCESMLRSAPPALIPLVRDLRLGGTFALDAGVTFDFTKRDPPDVTWKMHNDCRVDAIPDSLAPARFRRPWRREVIGADGRPVVVETGPGTPTWVPLDSISPHMVTAILICEDSRFFRHDGFDQEAIAGALRDNLAQRRFVRGASTVSMQLAKNLFLYRDKTASRKLQEAVLTLLLEQTLSKEDLIELYLNVVEFGPGIYGIGPAAAYYFSSPAHRLSLGQSLYLASVLPNPASHHFDRSGNVTEKWHAYLHKLMHIAHKIHRVSDEELEAGLEEVVAFQHPYEPPLTEVDLPDTAGLFDTAAEPAPGP